MDNFKFIISIVTLTILTSCNNNKTSNSCDIDTVLESRLEQLSAIALKDSIICFRMDTLTNYSWDTLLIMPPYTDISQLETKTKVDLSIIRTTKISSDEVSNVLGFVKNGRLITYLDFSRDKGDFSSIDSTIFTKSNCEFEFFRTNKEFVSGKKIIEVKAMQ